MCNIPESLTKIIVNGWSTVVVYKGQFSRKGNDMEEKHTGTMVI